MGLRFGTDFDANGHDLYRSVIGGQLDRRLSRRFDVAAAVNFYPTLADGAVWASADVDFRPPFPGDLVYVGTGLTGADRGANRNRVGADVLFGLEPRTLGAVHPFAEGKWVVYRKYTAFTVQGGIAIGL